MKVVIRTDELSGYFGQTGEIKAVDELDFGVYEGETFGLLGLDRLGKTTTVRMYAWLYEQMLHANLYEDGLLLRFGEHESKEQERR